MKQEMHKPQISIDIRRKRIRIHKVTLELLDHPQFILLLVNPETRTIAVMPSGDVKTAHCIHWERLKKTYELTSIGLIRSLCSVCPEWSDSQNYRITGEFIPSENIVEFRMDQAVPISYVAVNTK